MERYVTISKGASCHIADLNTTTKRDHASNNERSGIFAWQQTGSSENQTFQQPIYLFSYVMMGGL